MEEEAEQKRLAEEAEQKRLAEIAERERQKEAARQAKLQAAAAAEEQKAKRARLLRKKNQLEQQYKQSIRKAVTKKFRPPAGLRPGATCTVRARLVFPNEIIDVQVEQCSGGGAQMARAVEKAVLAANPFPVPPHRAVFQRVLVFEFKPNS